MKIDTTDNCISVGTRCYAVAGLPRSLVNLYRVILAILLDTLISWNSVMLISWNNFLRGEQQGIFIQGQLVVNSRKFDYYNWVETFHIDKDKEILGNTKLSQNKPQYKFLCNYYSRPGINDVNTYF